MSANPTDEALARLNYFNGQRLVAADLRSEQAYHLAMRRVLNRSLYAPGIVTGFEVEPDGSDVHRVVVRQGLAFDQLGREIYLPADVSVYVNGTPSTAPGVVMGNLLVVSYREQRAFPVATSCVVGAPYRACGSELAWGAPTRVLADAVFEVLDSWPAADSGKVVLAQIEFSPTCTVVRCAPGVRKYAVPVKAGKTRVLSLVGDGDVAPEAPKVLHFHIADGLPERAQLYLRGGRISSLWYSELARHTHNVHVRVDDDAVWKKDLTHSHSLQGSMSEDGAHRHTYQVRSKKELGGVAHADGAWVESDGKYFDTDRDNPIVSSGAHTHDLSDVELGPPDPALSLDLTPDFSTSSVDETGMVPGVRTHQNPYTYFKELAVKLDGTTVTAKILEQLPTLAQLGVGESTTPDSEPFVAEGSAAIDLLLLGIDLLPGAHKLEFVVPDKQGGGKLFYALYID
jgi:hypothetical protein